MSAIAVIRRDDAIVIANDTIAYDDQGIVRSVTAGKVMPVPELNCVIGNVGAGDLTQWLRVQMSQRYHSFDHVLTGFADDFRQTYAFMVDRGLAAIDQKATAIICGWSDENNRPEAYRVSVRDKEMIGPPEIGTISVPAFTLAPMFGDWCSSVHDDDARFNLSPDGNRINLVTLAGRYICAARATSSQTGSGDFDGVPYYVGGALHLTVLQNRRLETWVTHQWPDALGVPMDKNAGDPLPAHLLVQDWTDEVT